MKPREYLEVADVEIIHAMVLEHSGGDPGVRDRGALEAAVFRPRAGYYADVLEEAAALFESLIQNHPFVDGNKRTALAAVEVFLNYNEYTLRAEPAQTNKFLIRHIAGGTLSFTLIKNWLIAHVRAAEE